MFIILQDNIGKTNNNVSACCFVPAFFRGWCGKSTRSPSRLQATEVEEPYDMTFLDLFGSISLSTAPQFGPLEQGHLDLLEKTVSKSTSISQQTFTSLFWKKTNIYRPVTFFPPLRCKPRVPPPNARTQTHADARRRTQTHADARRRTQTHAVESTPSAR